MSTITVPRTRSMLRVRGRCCSAIMVWRASSAEAQIFEHFEKVGEGLRHASGVQDANAGCGEADDGKAHGHAVVVVGFDRGRLRGARMNDETVALFFCADAKSRELAHHCGDAVGFLLSNEADAGDARR